MGISDFFFFLGGVAPLWFRHCRAGWLCWVEASLSTVHLSIEIKPTICEFLYTEFVNSQL